MMRGACEKAGHDFILKLPPTGNAQAVLVDIPYKMLEQGDLPIVKRYYSYSRGRSHPFDTMVSPGFPTATTEITPLLVKQSQPTVSVVEPSSSRLLFSQDRRSLVRSATTSQVLPSSSGASVNAVQSTSRLPPGIKSSVRSQQPHTLSTRTSESCLSRPTFFRRVTDTVAQALDLQPESSSSRRRAPPMPSYWTDHAYSGTLLKTWDVIHERQSNSGRNVGAWNTLATQLALLETKMLQAFAELGQGEVVLSQRWMEYVLGLNLRHPFCSRENMGRWQILGAASAMGGSRAWGPW